MEVFLVYYTSIIYFLILFKFKFLWNFVFFSLQLIHRKLSLWNSDEPVDVLIKTPFEINAWEHDPELVSAVWNLAKICNNENMTDSIEVVADLISRV